MQKVIVLRGALAAALAVFILTSASGEARRVHDPDKATKIRTERTTNAPKNNDFRARIDALMKNANEINALCGRTILPSAFQRRSLSMTRPSSAPPLRVRNNA